ncbi:enoyl-CoA hydratase-related protein [Flavobacteriaceae bacterium]|jgi:enoyl-CoA hydratase|nr:enoyl-CoA hydratase-related protein [Flavobacteriaceae bacterium]
MNYNTILSNFSDGITTITINRPTKLNALNTTTIFELHTAFKTADLDFETKVIILTGSGEKAFVAGADISAFAHFEQEEGRSLAKQGQDLLFDMVENLSTPVIAAVNGYALGGGLELAMSAHFRVASSNALMGLPEVSLGLIPGYGGTQRLAQLVGKGRALELIMTANMIDAQKALSYGLVNHVVLLEELLPKCYALADKIKSNSSLAIAAAIRAVNANYTDGVNGYDVEISEFGKCFDTDDFVEGTTAFLEKRKSNFPGK